VNVFGLVVWLVFVWNYGWVMWCGGEGFVCYFGCCLFVVL